MPLQTEKHHLTLVKHAPRRHETVQAMLISSTKIQHLRQICKEKGARFSLQQLDAPYLEAVERGDMETEDVARKDQINLREGTKMAMGAKKRSAEETASPNNSDHSTAISSADGAKILNNLYNLAKKYQEKSNRPKTFIGDVADALGIDMPNKSSKYGTFKVNYDWANTYSEENNDLSQSEARYSLSTSNQSAMRYDKVNGTNVKEFFDFLRNGKVFEEGKPDLFHIANAGELLQRYGIKGKFMVGKFTFSKEHTQDEAHNLGVKEWVEVINTINTPLAITTYKGRENSIKMGR